MKIRGEFLWGEGVHVHVDWVLLETKNIEIKIEKDLEYYGKWLDRYLIDL